MRSKKNYMILPAIVCAAALALTACGSVTGDNSPAESGSSTSAERDDHDHEGRYGDTGRDGDGAADKIGNAVEDIGDTAGDVITGAGDTVGDVVTGAADVVEDAVTGAADIAGHAVTGVGNTAGDIVGGSHSVTRRPSRGLISRR